MTPSVVITAISCTTLVIMLACASGQTQHGYLRIMHSNPRVRALVTLYEGALLCHILLMASCNLEVLRTGLIWDWADGSKPTPIPDAALWFNFALAALTFYIALIDMSDSGEPESTRWMPIVETVLILFATPPALRLIDDMRVVVIVADTMYFLFRTAFLIMLDVRNSKRIVSPLSIAEAIKHLPEGVLYLDRTGHELLLNDEMRRCLSALDIASTNSSADALWQALSEKALGEHGLHVPSEYTSKPGEWIILRIDAEDARLFSFEKAGDAPQRTEDDMRTHSVERVDAAEERAQRTPSSSSSSSLIIAYDVTQEIGLLEAIDAANDKLEASRGELVSSLGSVREAAENEAMLRMRGRVHDVIGQRLSMLHRSLEDNDISDEKVAMLTPLLVSIVEDLNADMLIDPAEELDAIIDAFSLVGVEIIARGDLPADPQRAKIFADAIREAATNAVRHASARKVTAEMDERTLEISNDGLPAESPIAEGTGISTIRHAVEAEGGTLAIVGNPFALHIELP